MSEIFQTNQERDLNGMLKSGAAFQFVSAFEKSKAIEIDENGEKKKYIEFDASSNSEDLAGDVMEISALQDMVSNAPGTIMLRDHNRSVEKVFGSITEANLINENGKTILRMRAIVDEEDPQNIRIWKSIRRGVKLGASVTVVILEKKNNTRRKDSLIIIRCKLLEVSIVTIPANQDAWTIAATASKALALSSVKSAETESFQPVFNAENSNQEEEVMKPETTEKGVEAVEEVKNAGETVEEVKNAAAPEETEGSKSAGENKVAETVFPVVTKTLEAIKQAQANNEDIEIVVKGMFNEILKQKPSFWKLCDILDSVRWNLCYQKSRMEDAGITDFSPLITAWDEACAEFVIAAKDSFLYWGKFNVEEAQEETELAATEHIAIQKSFEIFADNYPAAGEDLKPSLQLVADQFVATAKAAGIPLNPEVVETAAPEITEDVIRKSQIFQDAEKRADNAEKALEETQKELEAAKVGLQAAAEAIDYISDQPLLGANGQRPRA